MPDEQRPKHEPSFDTQALLGVSDAELADGQRPRGSARGGKLPWPWIGAGAGVLLLGIGLAAWIRASQPSVVAMPLEGGVEAPASASGAAGADGEGGSRASPASGSGAATGAGAGGSGGASRAADFGGVQPAPDPSRPAVTSPAVPIASPAPRASDAPRDRGARPVRPEATPRAKTPSGPDDVDRALERLSTQTGDQLAAAESWEAARAAYARECASGRAASCARWGGLLADGKGGPADDGGARDAYGQACRLRSAEGCLALARRAEGRAALEALEAACDLASAAGCRAAAEHVETNGGGEARVLSLRARACALGDRASCATTRTSSTP